MSQNQNPQTLPSARNSSMEQVKGKVVETKENYVYFVTPQSCVFKKANFAKHIGANFAELYRTRQFADVTLVSGKEFVKAHQVILALKSDYFRQVFQEAPSKHPVVILKDVKPDTLKHVLQFLYTGEVKLVEKQQINDFTKAVEELKIRCNTARSGGVSNLDISKGAGTSISTINAP